MRVEFDQLPSSIHVKCHEHTPLCVNNNMTDVPQFSNLIVDLNPDFPKVQSCVDFGFWFRLMLERGPSHKVGIWNQLQNWPHFREASGEIWDQSVSPD